MESCTYFTREEQTSNWTRKLFSTSACVIGQSERQQKASGQSRLFQFWTGRRSFSVLGIDSQNNNNEEDTVESLCVIKAMNNGFEMLEFF